jgi:hypothetical protein
VTRVPRRGPMPKPEARKRAITIKVDPDVAEAWAALQPYSDDRKEGARTVSEALRAWFDHRTALAALGPQEDTNDND